MRTSHLAALAATTAALMIILSLAAPALAQATATPTPTMGWTETPWPRAAPTLWSYDGSTIDTSGFSFAEEGRVGNVADTIIQAYHFINIGGAVDLLITVGMMVLTFTLMMRLFRRFKQNA